MQKFASLSILQSPIFKVDYLGTYLCYGNTWQITIPSAEDKEQEKDVNLP